MPAGGFGGIGVTLMMVRQGGIVMRGNGRRMMLRRRPVFRCRMTGARGNGSECRNALQWQGNQQQGNQQCMQPFHVNSVSESGTIGGTVI